MAGFSIPAAEHSTITSWTKSGEGKAFANMLEQFPTGLVAVVSDSYDIYHAVSNIWGKELRDQVLKRDGTLVIRPDSGDPIKVVVKVLDILGQAFGYSKNQKGYKILDPHIRVIQGDGIDFFSFKEVLETVKKSGWSTDNLAFGSGGGLLQKMDRDTCKFAIKCSATLIYDKWIDVFKDPITDPDKRSKKGRLKLTKEHGAYKTVREEELGRDELVTVFENGKLLIDQRFSDIRLRAKA